MTAATATRPVAPWSTSTPSAVAAAAAAAAAALLLGATTEVLQGVLPTGWGPLANSVSAWVLLPAVLVGAVLAAAGWRGRRSAVLAVGTGLATALGLVAGYYGWAALVSGTPHAASSVLVWSGAGVVSGVLSGVCALAWSRGRGAVRGVAVGVLAAVLLADGARTLLLLPWQAAAGWAFVVTAVVVPALVLRRGERLAAGTALVCAAALGAGGFALLDAVITLAGRR